MPNATRSDTKRSSADTAPRRYANRHHLTLVATDGDKAKLAFSIRIDDIAVSISSPSVAEGTAPATLTSEVTLNQATGRTVTVAYGVDGTDYTTVAGRTGMAETVTVMSRRAVTVVACTSSLIDALDSAGHRRGIVVHVHVGDGDGGGIAAVIVGRHQHDGCRWRRSGRSRSCSCSSCRD